MVNTRLVLIDLPKPGHLVRKPLVTEAKGGLELNILFNGLNCTVTARYRAAQSPFGMQAH